MKDTIGFRRGTSPSPVGEMVAVEVCSWLQIPALLQEISENPTCIRLTFPPCSDSALTAEQLEIHSFLSTQHGLSLDEVRSQLVAKIEKSVFFRNSEIPRKEEVFPTGEDWIEAFLFKPSTRGATLSVSEARIVDPEDIDASLTRLHDQIISTPKSASRDSQQILWLPSDMLEEAEKSPVKNRIIAQLSLFDTIPNTRVWIGESKITFGDVHELGCKGAPLAQLSWEEFKQSYLTPGKKPQQNDAEILPGVSRAVFKSIVDFSGEIEEFVSKLARIASDRKFNYHDLRRSVMVYVRGERAEGVPFLRSSVETSVSHPGAYPGATADEILQFCRTRSVSENVEKVLQALAKNDAHFWSRSQITKTERRSDVVTLPAKGKALFLTDLEGNVESVKRLIEKENILERWRVNDPDDQVYLCVLGDSVDRSETGQLLINYLLELKYRENFEDKVWLLAGNHEIDCIQQFNGREGFGYELLARRKNEISVDPADWDEWLQAVASLCPPSFKHEHFINHCGGGDNVLIKGGMWALYNGLFSRLPKMIRAENGAFAVHAGPPFAKLERLAHLVDSGQLKEPAARKDFLAERGKADEQYLDNTDLVWNDFFPEWRDESHPALDLSKTAEHRGIGRIYTAEAFERFAREFGVSMMVRGHQSMAPQGGEYLDGNKGSWRHGPVLTLVGGYAQLDLSIVDPKVSDVIVSRLSSL
jgi:hypothetical protein